MKDKHVIRSLVLLFSLVLCTACGPLELPAAEPSPASAATQTILVPASASPVLITPMPPTMVPLLDVDIDQLAIGPQGQIYARGYGNGTQQLPQPQLAQWEGGTWIALDTGYQSPIDALVVDRAGQLYAEFIMQSRPGLSNAIMKWDGTRWQDISANFGRVVDALQPGRLSSNIPVQALAVDGEDHLYAAGAFSHPGADNTAEFPMGYVAVWDPEQETWSVLGEGFDKVNVLALAVGPAGEVYVAGEQPRTPEGNSSFLARWDGNSWTQLDTRRLNSSGYLALDTSGGLYVSSNMSEPGGSIEYWDGTGWKTIPTRLGGEAPAIYDLAVDANGRLYIGGSFESVNGIPAKYVAVWDGSTWQALGGGFNREVNTLAFGPGGDLYAAGFFSEAGGLPVPHVARWDAERWHALAP